MPNFWLKQLTATHKHIAETFNKLIEADSMPEWLMAGVTYLIPKKRKYLISKELQTCDLSAYDIKSYYKYYKQTHAEI